MICHATDVEIEVLITRIQNKELELQPSFQRGEVWSSAKQKRLIDSILRDWKIPPIHLIRTVGYTDEVLDGQQRLVAIRDFVNDKIKIDGNIHPIDKKNQELDGKVYSDLDNTMKRQFNRYSITIINLKEYKAEEPAELFFRLNQPATLTSAEQRNAYISEPRNQVKSLVEEFLELGASTETIGFSNSRLAYDEIISKFCFTINQRTLRKKVTSNDLSSQYREDEAFDSAIITKTSVVLRKFMNSIKLQSGFNKLKLNKATLFSWLLFTLEHSSEISEIELNNLIYKFEVFRQYIKGKSRSSSAYIELGEWEQIERKYPYFETFLLIFNQRASMGSTDALSIVYRDIILNVFFGIYCRDKNDLLEFLDNQYKAEQNIPYLLESVVTKLNWGEVLR